MSLIPFDERAEWQRVIWGKAKDFQERAYEVLDVREWCRFYIEPSGLGICIGIQSRHARLRFDALKKTLFQSFEPHNFTTDQNGVTWARFGFSEPWNLSRYYIAENWVQI